MNRKKDTVIPHLETYSAPESLPEIHRNGHGSGEIPFDWIVPIGFKRPGPEPARKPAAPVPSFWPLRGPF